MLLWLVPSVACAFVTHKAVEVYGKITSFPVLHVNATLFGLL